MFWFAEKSQPKKNKTGGERVLSACHYDFLHFLHVTFSKLQIYFFLLPQSSTRTSLFAFPCSTTFYALIKNAHKNRWMETQPLSAAVIPPLLPLWYGLMRICRAAGLVILVSSWARLGSGSRPFLLLRICRYKENTHIRLAV